MKNRGRGLLLPIEFRVLTADRRSVAIFPLSLSPPPSLPFPSLYPSFPFLTLVRLIFFFSKKFLEGQKKKGRGCEEHPAALPSPSPLFRLFEFVERVRFRVYFRARVDVSQGRGGEGRRRHARTREWPILRARFTPREKFTPARGAGERRWGRVGGIAGDK